MSLFIQVIYLEHDNNHSQNTSSRFYAYNTRVLAILLLSRFENMAIFLYMYGTWRHAMLLGLNETLYESAANLHYSLQADLFIINPISEAFTSLKSFPSSHLAPGLETGLLYEKLTFYRNIFGKKPGFLWLVANGARYQLESVCIKQAPLRRL